MTEAFLQEFEARAGTRHGRGPRVARAGPPRGHRAVRADRVSRAAGRGLALHADRARSRRAPWRPATGGSGRLTREQLAPFVFGHAGLDHAGLRERRLRRGLSVGRHAAAGRAGRRAWPRRSGPTARCSRRTSTRHAPVEGSAVHRAQHGVPARRRRGARRRPASTWPRRSTCCSSPRRTRRGTVAHPRNLIVVERGARASVIESYVTLAPGQTYWTNPVTEVAVGGGRLGRAHPDPARERARVPRRAHPRGPAARQPLPLVLAGDGRRAGAAQPARAAQRREHRDADVRALPHPRRAGGRQPHGHLPRPAQLPELGGLQGHPRRPVARRCSTARCS